MIIVETAHAQQGAARVCGLAKSRVSGLALYLRRDPFFQRHMATMSERWLHIQEIDHAATVLWLMLIQRRR